MLSAEQLEGLPTTESTYHAAGDASACAETEVCEYLEGEDGRARMVLARSPFYAESGGQVGDLGVVEAQDGSFKFHVDDTQKLGEIIVHIGRAEGTPKKGAAVVATIDEKARARTQKHHTATHLLHRALREVLGDHVTQAGSYVGPDRLRFDLSHPKGVSQEELEDIERRVNRQIIQNATVQTTVEDLDAAKARGVMALFGEKYDEKVRVVDVGGWSTELCGGTHVNAAGDIGPFLILSERAIQAGVRRIEAVAGEAAVEEIQSQRRLLQGAARSVKSTPEELSERIGQLQKQVKEAKKKKAAASAGDIDTAFTQAKAELQHSGDVAHGVFHCPTLDPKGLGDLAARLAGAEADHALALIGGADGKVPFLILCAGKALEAGLQAGALAKGLRPILGGGGGGKPAKAQGQGEKADAVAEALDYLKKAITEGLS